jgi:small subunit ribosomal protein S1
VNEPDDDFAALFEASLKTKPLARGQTIEGRIVALGADVAFVDVGGKGEATLALDELKNDEGVVEVKVGDRIQATVVSTSDGVKLSRRLQRGAASRRQLEDAYTARLPVEGRVAGQVKGGFEVTVAGLRAFCPASQIDTARDTDPQTHIGRVYTFRIVEFGEDGRKFVVSRRALLEEEARERAAEVRRTLVAGAIVTGRVASVREFGAFVDLGGVQGLLHVSEMGWSRVNDPAQMFKPGDEVTVKVLRIEPNPKGGEDKIALGLKQLSDDPWSQVEAKYPVGQAVQGKVSRVAAFGVFVELEPGIVGLLPAPETGVGRDADLRKVFPIGKSVGASVVELDVAGRRMRLSIKAVQDAAEAAEVRDYAARSDASAETAGFGSLAEKLRGAMKGPKG